MPVALFWDISLLAVLLLLWLLYLINGILQSYDYDSNKLYALDAGGTLLRYSLAGHLILEIYYSLNYHLWGSCLWQLAPCGNGRLASYQLLMALGCFGRGHWIWAYPINYGLRIFAWSSAAWAWCSQARHSATSQRWWFSFLLNKGFMFTAFILNLAPSGRMQS